MEHLAENLGIEEKRSLELGNINVCIFRRNDKLSANIEEILNLSDVSEVEKGYMLFMLGHVEAQLNG